MRLTRVLPIIRSSARIPIASRRPRQGVRILRNGYCSRCHIDSEPVFLASADSTSTISEPGSASSETLGEIALDESATETADALRETESLTDGKLEGLRSARGASEETKPRSKIPKVKAPKVKAPKVKACDTPDHRAIARVHHLVANSPYSPGSPLFLPRGTKIFNKLTNFLRAQYAAYGFEEVNTPTIYKESLWKKSGHWENYAEDMYSVIGRGASGKQEGTELQEDEAYGLKPMNCPGHCLIFDALDRSYKDLPIRYADFGSLHRNEVHGALSGLTRVRRFHQDDGHIFCRPSQIRKEILKTLEFVALTYKVLGLKDWRPVLSTRPKDHYIGTVEEWDNAENQLKDALTATKRSYTINEGDGAFYGPKIDIMLQDSNRKEHQLGTVQLDFQLPKRFNLSYQSPAPEFEAKGLKTTDPAHLDINGQVTPVLIHRAVLGSVERIMALLLEQYGMKLPFWLSPYQCIILTVNDTQLVSDYARNVQITLEDLNDRTADGAVRIGEKISVDMDLSSRPLEKKLRDAKAQGYQVIVCIGKRDVAENTVTANFSQMHNVESYRNNSQLRTIAAKEAAKSEQPLKLQPSLANPTGVLSNDQLTWFPIQAVSLRKFMENVQRDYK